MVTGESLPVPKAPGSTRSSARRSTPPARCGSAPPRSARTPRSPRSSRWCRRRRTPRRPGSGWPTGPRSGSCWSRSSAAPCTFLVWLAVGRRRADGAAVRHHRRGDHLPRRARAGHPDRDHGRHRARRQARRAVQERHRAGDRGPHRHRRDGQDRHPHQGRARGHRRRRRPAIDEDELLALAAAVERESEHPLAAADRPARRRPRGVPRAAPSGSATCPVTAPSPTSTAAGSSSATGRLMDRRGRRARRRSPPGATSSPRAAAPRCSSPSTAGPPR